MKLIKISRDRIFLAAAGLFSLYFLQPAFVSAVEPEKFSVITSSKQALNWETGEGKSFLIPAIEVPSFLLALNMYDRAKYGNAVYGTNLDTIQDNLSHQNWHYDKDSFRMNQLGHPYQGSLMYGFARSSGLTFWQSLVYSNAGSLLWKVGGETGYPSINDQITTGQAGSVLGEALFRMANLTLEGGGDEPGFWRELGAGIISPPTALNRLFFGDRFRTIYPDHGPATFTYLQFSGSLQNSSGNQGVSRILNRKEVSADFAMAYGLPGKDGYHYERPFDYFNFEFTATSGKESFDNILTRGLIYGDKYESGDNYRGVWGLYGTYDYISPTVFRVSNTSAALGTTAQWWLSKNTALQGTVLAGPGYGGGGLTPAVGQRDYHMGATAQALVALRLTKDKKFMFDFNGRSYYISGISSPNTSTSERIDRADVSFTVLLRGPHAIGIQYAGTRRASHFPGSGTYRQTVGMTSFAYTLVFDPHFGAVEWRDGVDSGNR